MAGLKLSQVIGSVGQSACLASHWDNGDRVLVISVGDWGGGDIQGSTGHGIGHDFDSAGSTREPSHHEWEFRPNPKVESGSGPES